MNIVRANLIRFAGLALLGLGFVVWASSQDFSEFQKAPVEVHYSRRKTWKISTSH